MALIDDLSKKAAKLTEKTIEMADMAKLKISIKSTQVDLDKQFVELGKIYYEIVCEDNIIDEKSVKIVQEINRIKNKIEQLENNLKNK